MTLHAPNLHALADLVGDGDVVVLSGAGLSTESGIPDYRGPSSAGRPAQPMTYQTFVGSEAARRRYWARSHVGWRHIARARPNDGHLAVARLQYAGLLSGIITQNVDGLHQANRQYEWISKARRDVAASIFGGDPTAVEQAADG